MKIALDATPLFGRFGGIEGALWQTLLALQKLSSPHEFHVFVPADAPPSPFADGNWHWRRLRFEGAQKLRRIAWQQIELPLWLRREGFDLLHATNYVMPLASPIRTVVSIPDLIALDCPRFATRENRLHYRALLPQTLKRADVLLASTPKGRAAILRRAPHAQVVVAPLGVEASWFETPSAQEVEEARRRFDLPSHFLLFAGNLEPKKNLPRLIRAASLLGEGAPQLVIVGGIKPWRELEELKMRARFLGFVSQGDLRVLMSECAVFCFPSLAEGFGLPVLEALASGARVVASGKVPIPGLHTVARVPNPHSVSAIADAIRAALDDSHFDPKHALAFAKLFSYHQTARVWLQTYESVSVRG